MKSPRCSIRSMALWKQPTPKPMKAMRQSADRRKAAFGRASFRAFRRWCFRGSCWKNGVFVAVRHGQGTSQLRRNSHCLRYGRGGGDGIQAHRGCACTGLRSDRRAAQKILSAYLNLLTVYPDQPYDQKPILYPDSDVPIVEPENIGDADTLGEKNSERWKL